MKELTNNRKLLIFAVFFFIAAVLWLLDSLNQFYKTQIKLPVVFTNLPKQHYVEAQVPKSITLMVDGYGYDLLKYTLKTSIKPIVINLSSIELKPITPSDTNNFFIISKQIENQISSQIRGKIKILDIKPDTLLLKFIPLFSKKVPVRADIKIFYAKQYINKKPLEIIPDIVEIIGPADVIDTIEYVYTEPIELHNVHSNINQQVQLKVPPNTKVKPQQVRLKLEVEQYTELTVKVPIKTLNVPPNYALKVFPNKVTIKYKLGFSNYNRIRAENFVVAVDYNDIAKLGSDKLPVHVLHVPEGIYDYSYTPHTVDYIIEEKND